MGSLADVKTSAPLPSSRWGYDLRFDGDKSVGVSCIAVFPDHFKSESSAHDSVTMW